MYRKHPTQKHWWKPKLSPRPLLQVAPTKPPGSWHARQHPKLLLGLSCFSPALPGRYCCGTMACPPGWTPWVRHGELCPQNPALNKVAGSIINKMAVCLHIFLIDFPLPFAQAAQVSPIPPSCSANTGQMERDSPSRLLAPTFVMRSGPSSFLPATSPDHSFQPPLLPKRILSLSGA